MTLPERTPAQTTNTEKRSVAKGLFSKCGGCGAVFTAEELGAKWHVCSSCDFHHPMSSNEWRSLLLDEGRLEVWDDHITSADPLNFQDGKSYPERLLRAQRNTKASDAVEIGSARIEGLRLAYGCYIF
ncbi:MAG TPA: acetyl-CoA carboxylase carboxyl transferase subunit beta, partial [Polyangiaceae bacterium]|nr:acetyl-CoA carboxylase carboxyl transferase subunit beta [Polyangiaceae bacterium]